MEQRSVLYFVTEKDPRACRGDKGDPGSVAGMTFKKVLPWILQGFALQVDKSGSALRQAQGPWLTSGTCSGEFLKVQPGTGDNLSAEDIAAGFTDYVIWNRFRAKCLDIDGELEMECVDSGMVLLKEDESMSGAALRQAQGPWLTSGTLSPGMAIKKVLEFAYGESRVMAIPLLWQ